MTCAKYSLGLLCEELEEDYKDMVYYLLEIGSEKIGYVHFIEVFSLGILLEVSNEELEKMVALADEDALDDCLFDYLVSACGLKRKHQSKGYQKAKPYKETEKIIQVAQKDKKTGAKELKQYMEKKWFQGHYDYGWKNAHKGYGYVGFWSFETGALAKILGLDDEALKSNNHYPYDLVHYKAEKNFSMVVENEEMIEKSSDDEPENQIHMKESVLEQIIPNVFRRQTEFFRVVVTLPDFPFF